MHVNAQFPGESLKADGVTIKADATKLMESERFPPALTLEPRKTSAFEKSFIGVIQPFQCPALQIKGNTGKFYIFTKLSDSLALVKITASLASFLITVNTLLKRGII